MIENKKINLIVALAVVFALVVSISMIYIGNSFDSQGAQQLDAEYAEKIFGQDIISVEVITNENVWQTMLDNALEEQYIMVDVIVNGQKFQNVGIRPKGNSSLSQVAGTESDRYSFRLKFDEYIKGQTCFGLDSFVVNNMHADSTYMKEYISYELMREAGVNTPYFGFAEIKVNGEYQGLYLAVELYGDGYEERTSGTTTGTLYNVKMSMGGNRPDRREGELLPPRPEFQANAENNQENDLIFPPVGDRTEKALVPENREPGNMAGGFAAMGGRGGSGGSLEYIDDNSTSYSSIFDNVVGKGTEKDYQRVIQALKALSVGEDLEEYFEVDQILRYLAAHTLVVNLDSYSSGMAQNYYIYEQDGKISILPWDYNLAWGGFQGGNVSSVINFPIDTPISGVEMESRPLIDKLFAKEEYLERYHSYLQQLLNSYFSNGKFAEKIQTLDALISDYVRNDPTAFYTHEEYKEGIAALTTLGNLRALSVQGQLEGSIPSTTAGQSKNPELLISGEDSNLAALGNNRGGFERENRNVPNQRGIENPSTEDSRKNSLIFLGSLLLVLLLFTAIVAKLKKNY